MMIRAADRVTQRERDGAGSHQNEDEGIGEGANEAQQNSETRFPLQAVGTVEIESPFRFCGSQACRGGLQLLKQVMERRIPEAIRSGS